MGHRRWLAPLKSTTGHRRMRWRRRGNAQRGSSRAALVGFGGEEGLDSFWGDAKTGQHSGPFLGGQE